MPVTTKTDLFARKVFEHYKKGNSDSDLGIQNVFTPIRTIESAVNHAFHDFLTPETKNVAVLFNWEFFVSFGDLKPEQNSYIKNIKFTYFYDSELDVKMLRAAAMGWLLEQIELVNISEFTEQNKDFNIIEKAMTGKHFDIVFSNPPYGNIDLKILQVLYTNNITDNAVFIHPAGWLFDLKEKSQAMQFKAVLKDYLKSAFIFDGCKVFKTSTGDSLAFHFPEVITVFSNNKADTEKIQVTDELIHKTYQADTIFDISIFHEMKKVLFNNLISKTQKDNLLMHMSNDKKYTFALMRIIGNARKADDTKNSGYPYFGPKFFTLIPKNMEDQSSYTMKTHDVFSFDTEVELNNFKKFLTTKVARICLAWLKISQNINSGRRAACVPWMDFMQEWNDAKLCEEFNIDEELWNYIDNFIPDYYEDYDDGFTNKAKNVISRHHGIEPNDEMKTLCPAEVIDYLMHTTITCKSGYVSRGFTRNGYSYQAYKRNNNDGDDTTFAWCVTRNAKHKNN